MNILSIPDHDMSMLPFPYWRGKPVMLSKHASEEILNDNVPVPKVLEALETGIETDEKRKDGIFEFVKGYRTYAIKVIVAKRPESWVVVTVIKFRR